MVNWILYALVAGNMLWASYMAAQKKHDVASFFMTWAIFFYITVTK